MTVHRLLLAGLGLAAILVVWSAAAGEPVPQDRDVIGIGAAKGTKVAAIRVGTFDRQQILMAFYQSTAFDKKMKGWQAEAKKAEAAGDEAKVKEIEDKGKALQELAHKQLAGEAPITEILDHLKKDMPKVAKLAGVQMIVEKPIFSDGTVELVDITKQMAACLGPAKKG